jgi:prepilin-type N-terminal cleavage/methylation domain-containing protein
MNKKGFTMIELLVVIAIIGLLSALGIVALSNARMKSRDSRRVGDVSRIQTALEMYYSDYGKYPSVAGNLGDIIDLGGTSYKCLSEVGFSASCVGQIYMAQVPSYPNPRTDKDCSVANAGYFYKSHTNTDASSYRIQYCLGGTSGGAPEYLNYACPSGKYGCNW